MKKIIILSESILLLIVILLGCTSCESKEQKNKKNNIEQQPSKKSGKKTQNNKQLQQKRENKKIFNEDGTTAQTCNHKWQKQGRTVEETYDERYECTGIENGKGYQYLCKLCYERVSFDNHIYTIEDLKNHLIECAEAESNGCIKYDDVTANYVICVTDNEVINRFYIIKPTPKPLFLLSGYKCEKCGKTISVDEAKALGIL